MGDNSLPRIYLARHGQTEWSLSGQHTGRTDLPLTAQGEANARMLGSRLQGISFAQIFTSPLKRARRTCELAGFDGKFELDSNLVEWNYGDYEGLTTTQVHEIRPGWNLFHDGCAGGESVEAICSRADRIVARWRQLDGDILAFSSGHILRVIAARWLNLPASAGALFMLDTAAICILGYEHDRTEPAIRLWNDVHEATH